MFQSFNLVVILSTTLLLQSTNSEIFNSWKNTLADNSTNWATILNVIYKEKPFESILVGMDQNARPDELWDTIFQYQKENITKLILTVENEDITSYKFHFNSNVLAVIIMRQEINEDLMETMAQALDYMRETRILIIAVNVENTEDFKAKGLELLEKYKITNVVLVIHSSLNASEIPREWWRIRPYLQYHWQLFSLCDGDHSEIYPHHWLNMANKTVITYPDQYPPNTIVYKDSAGDLRLTGYVALLVMEFAKHYNVHLQMFQTLEEEKFIHFTEITQMVDEGLLDIPMSTDGGGTGSWYNMSDAIEITEVAFMVPLSSQLTISEVFTLLLDGFFFASVLGFSFLLSFILTLGDYFFEDLLIPLNFLINSKVMPGILGQSFVERFTHIIGLRMVYFFIGFVGLNISTQFSANVNSFFTSPPYHGQLETYEDLEHSPVKILIEESDAAIMQDWLPYHPTIVTYTNNLSYFLNSRQNFVTAYGYVIQSNIWNIYNRRQQYYRHKAFHVPRGMIYLDMMIWGIRLQYNSPYKQALNEFIQNCHDSGLMSVWKSQTYLDMSKLKRVPLQDPHEESGPKVLEVKDFFWIWLLVVIGWLVSLLVFFLELFIDRWLE
ncbi:uncharacterized protein LOC142224468 [Haematobia irritans]|uniref:uncharacterized protein LOC142224468 n=1 Tax=Haematobia irritans TaxID=7368 RepID=UPI003F4FB001